MKRLAPGAPSKAERVAGPAYILAAVHRALRVALLTKSRAVLPVVERLGVGEPLAESFIRKKLRDLKESDYAHSVILPWQPPVTADVYGVVDEHGAWYIKFYRDPKNGRFLVCSCHEPDFDLELASGEKIKRSS